MLAGTVPFMGQGGDIQHLSVLSLIPLLSYWYASKAGYDGSGVRTLTNSNRTTASLENAIFLCLLLVPLCSVWYYVVVRIMQDRA